MVSKDSIRAFAPATVANVGSAFDIMGFALSAPGDEVIVTQNNIREARVVEISGDQGRLSLNPAENTASVAVQALLNRIGESRGIDIRLRKDMPLGSGLGSSAASAAAALVAANSLLGEPLSRKELIPCALQAEKVACGAAHGDNVAPAILGGFVLITGYEPFDCVRLQTELSLWCTTATPAIEVRTEDARRILKATVPLQSVVSQLGRVASLVTALTTNSLDLLATGLQDSLIVPQRKALIPGFDRVYDAALNAGAIGCSISGSGPTVFAISISQDSAHNIGEAMRESFHSVGLESQIVKSAINMRGATVL